MTHRVLYIEDNIYNQCLVRKLLEAKGLVVDEALDGLQGIKKADQLVPDLILVDLNLPYLDGIGTITKIKSLQTCHNVPVVAMVSKRAPEDRERVLVAGCDGIIDMPVDAERFPDEVAEFISGKRSNQEVAQKSAILQDYNLTLIDQLQEKIEALEGANRDLAQSKIEIQKALEKSQEANEELKRLNQLKQHIIAVSSHELRTPLSIALGYFDILDNGFVGELTDEQLHVIRQGLESLGKLENLIEKVCDLGRASHKKFPARVEKIFLPDVFREVMQQMSFFMNLRDLSVEEEIGPDIPNVMADSELMEQVFSNLLRNAICYTPDGGSINVIFKKTDEGVQCVVKDTGIGLSESDLPHVFDEFYQAQHAENHKSGQFEFMTRGLGLGLSICRSILTNLGGKIWVESPGRNQGTSVTLVLPKAG